MNFELTDEQKVWLKKHAKEYNYSVAKLTRDMTGDESKDGRSIEGQAVKQFIIEHLDQKPQMNLPPKGTFELDEEQKLFIRNNLVYYNTTAEILPVLFSGIENRYTPNQMKLCKEIQAIQRYVNEIDPSFIKNNRKNVSKFVPPKDLKQSIEIVNKYTGLDLELKSIRDDYIASIEKLKINLKNVRLIKTLSGYPDKDEEEIFLNSFVRDTWDKPDLTSGELELYCDLADERVHLFKIKEHQSKLQEAFDEALNSTDGKIQYTLVESIDKQIQNRDKCMARIANIQKSLEGTRDSRLKNAPKREVTILKIIEILKKGEERERYLKMAEMEREALKNEINRLEDLSEYNARILGISKEEILN